MAGLNVQRRRIIVGITGASGAVYGVKLLEALRNHEVEAHAVVSDAGWRTLQHELAMGPSGLSRLAHTLHDCGNPGAPIASGSFACEAMVVAPCSMHTLAAIANGLAGNLLTRAADVMLKERKRLVLLARETPLHLVHLRNMVSVTEMGAIVCPPVPAFYAKPQTIEELVGHTAGRVLDLLGVENSLAPRWAGLEGG